MAAKQLTRKQVETALGWDVERQALQLADGTEVKSHFANARVVEGNTQILGVVGKGYRVIQNKEILDLAESLRKKHKLRFTHAGVVGNGERVYFQCSGPSFPVSEGDEITPYMLFVNAHDGSLACRMAPMTERMVCQNQLANFVRDQPSFVSIRHSGNVKQKLEEVGRLGRHYMSICQANRAAMVALRKKRVTKKKMTRFFETLYLEQIREVTTDPKTRNEDLARNRADVAFQKFRQRFENEIPVAGSTAWNMANAYTGWLQHDYRVGKDPARSQKRRRQSSLFGILAQRSVIAFQAALNA